MFVIAVEQDTATAVEETVEWGLSEEATKDGMGTSSSEATIDTTNSAEETRLECGIAAADEEGGHSIEATKDGEGNNSSEATMTPEYGRYYSFLCAKRWVGTRGHRYNVLCLSFQWIMLRLPQQRRHWSLA